MNLESKLSNCFNLGFGKFIKELMNLTNEIGSGKLGI
jgi:hypothetical protein